MIDKGDINERAPHLKSCHFFSIFNHRNLQAYFNIDYVNYEVKTKKNKKKSTNKEVNSRNNSQQVGNYKLKISLGFLTTNLNQKK